MSSLRRRGGLSAGRCEWKRVCRVKDEPSDRQRKTRHQLPTVHQSCSPLTPSTQSRLSFFQTLVFFVKRFKLMKWWLQSFLLAIPTIVCGYRDDQGIVRHIETYKTEELPKMAQVPQALVFMQYVSRYRQK